MPEDQCGSGAAGSLLAGTGRDDRRGTPPDPSQTCGETVAGELDRILHPPSQGIGLGRQGRDDAHPDRELLHVLTAVAGFGLIGFPLRPVQRLAEGLPQGFPRGCLNLGSQPVVQDHRDDSKGCTPLGRSRARPCPPHGTMSGALDTWLRASRCRRKPNNWYCNRDSNGVWRAAVADRSPEAGLQRLLRVALTWKILRERREDGAGSAGGLRG